MIPKSVAAAILFIFLIVALLIITMIWVGRKTQQCAKREASNRDLSSFASKPIESCAINLSAKDLLQWQMLNESHRPRTPKNPVTQLVGRNVQQVSVQQYTDMVSPYLSSTAEL